MPDNGQTGCVLTERKSGKPAGKPADFWQAGEVDVTRKLSSAPGTDEDYAAARDEAIRRAKARCADMFSCNGKCRDKDSFCVGDVEVLEDRSGWIESREVDVPETPFGGPAHKETRRFVTYEVRVRCKCGCARRPVHIVPGSGAAVEAPVDYQVTPSDLKALGIGLRLEVGVKSDPAAALPTSETAPGRGQR